jgi:hypothetical protein
VDAAAPPLPRRGARRRCLHGCYRASFSKRKTPERRGDDGEPIPGQNTAGGRLEGHPPRPAMEELAGVHVERP